MTPHYESRYRSLIRRVIHPFRGSKVWVGEIGPRSSAESERTRQVYWTRLIHGVDELGIKINDWVILRREFKIHIRVTEELDEWLAAHPAFCQSQGPMGIQRLNMSTAQEAAIWLANATRRRRGAAQAELRPGEEEVLIRN
ncbi:hypothetical protein HYFRA_00010633 [Hymenoscyphus fraxineus]|uniref:Uncharacterized protein n=1 Tax=Hymenoscyphus fraxineus TaxID=746836 RepID=A0A9N9PMX9_9HELO|nr:hypothetical protein HYFRA_00010633 [Hymenoscyphus fraxineus]